MNKNISKSNKDFSVVKRYRVVYTGEPVDLFTNDKEYDLDVMTTGGHHSGEWYEEGDAFIVNDDEGHKHWVTKDWYPKNFTIVNDIDPLP